MIRLKMTGFIIVFSSISALASPPGAPARPTFCETVMRGLSNAADLPGILRDIVSFRTKQFSDLKQAYTSEASVSNNPRSIEELVATSTRNVPRHLYTQFLKDAQEQITTVVSILEKARDAKAETRSWSNMFPKKAIIPSDVAASALKQINARDLERRLKILLETPDEANVSEYEAIGLIQYAAQTFNMIKTHDGTEKFAGLRPLTLESIGLLSATRPVQYRQFTTDSVNSISPLDRAVAQGYLIVPIAGYNTFTPEQTQRLSELGIITLQYPYAIDFRAPTDAAYKY